MVFDADSEARGTLRRSRWRLTEEERRERERERGGRWNGRDWTSRL